MSSNLPVEESPSLVENESEVERLNRLVTSLRSELLLAAEENEREQVRANQQSLIGVVHICQKVTVLVVSARLGTFPMSCYVNGSSTPLR
jgi:hypothetical protein